MNDYQCRLVQASKSSHCKQRFALSSTPIVISNPKLVHELTSDIVESIASRSIQRDLPQLRRLMSGPFCHEPDGPSEGFISCQKPGFYP